MHERQAVLENFVSQSHKGCIMTRGRRDTHRERIPELPNVGMPSVRRCDITRIARAAMIEDTTTGTFHYNSLSPFPGLIMRGGGGFLRNMIVIVVENDKVW